MNKPDSTSRNVALWAFLDELKSYLRAVREDQNALRLSLRRTCEHFKVEDGCIAIAAPDGSRAQLISAIPRGGKWDVACLAAFLQRQRPRIPPNIIMAPVHRRGRLWAVLALRGQREFQIPSGLHSAKASSETDLRIDRSHRLAAQYRRALTNRSQNFGTAASTGPFLPNSARPSVIDALRPLFGASNLRPAGEYAGAGRRTNCVAERQKPSNRTKTAVE